MTIELGLILPTSTPDPSRPVLGDARAAARLAEGAGVESVWSTDHLIASAPMLDSTVVLATAAAVTERVKIGYGVMLLALRPVAWAAKQVTSLQHVSGDRLLLGVGTGNPAHGDVGWRAAGTSFESRGRRTDEALQVLPDLIAGRKVQLEEGLEAAIAPGATVPPLLVAGDGQKALARAARFGDGWVSIGLAVDDVPARIAALEDLAAGYDRPRPALTIVGPQVDDIDEAKAVDQLAAYAEAGVERVILVPGGDGWEQGYERAARLRAAL
ncbi:Coenzyme F420-dependent N5 N10-methylene tetrahydromethanopterin reductase-like protein [Kribbella flavida DSM 17836]|uniref:Coenzyme F420-dependent N5 N10-methylene tetrahydromethanopterin reductase-like protein n=1 Tax=Kribbella flavida (strain DSM 17836 / JCM 10339 / NBRC 14399) TaxID=479435 RepID=D2PNI7_KRIFD|nr:LLM class flavin-dependent oxidoreductase [Kribbella flavida]ADB30839.1 Coenzyme F420-dependent N5 N10-methylene tetrahydromethanopterin reductase-like protein [Kribbella flavida DSM 17836]